MFTSFLQEVSPNETCVLVFEADGRRLGGLTAKKVNFGKEYRVFTNHPPKDWLLELSRSAIPFSAVTRKVMFAAPGTRKYSISKLIAQLFRNFKFFSRNHLAMDRILLVFYRIYQLWIAFKKRKLPIRAKGCFSQSNACVLTMLLEL